MYANIVSKGIYVDTFLKGIETKEYKKNGEFKIDSNLVTKKIAINFDNVNFRYQSSDETIFQDLNIFPPKYYEFYVHSDLTHLDLILTIDLLRT